MDHSASTLIEWVGLPLARWFWRERKDILDRSPLAAVFSLNRRNGANAGRGRGFRSQSNANRKRFRKCDTDMPRFTN
jgi:hypothetical protein